MSALLSRRAVTSGTLGGVAAGSRIAAGIGLATLLEGGNAFDAAVAAALAETVVLPSKCGMAGDLVALWVRPGDVAPTSLVALGGAAAGLEDAARSAGWRVPATGGLSVGVPGAPAGYDRLASLGRLGRTRLVAPAAALARRGAPWGRLSALLAHEARELLLRHQPDGCTYAPGGLALEPGVIVPIPRLAALLDDFAERGAGLFAGPSGRAVVDRVAAAGGVLTMADLQSVELLEQEAPGVPTPWGRLAATAAPTYGRALLEAFAGVGPADVGPEHVAAVLAAQAKGDLLVPAGEGTSSVAAADDSGNVVVVVHSNSFPQFGSGLVVEELDLVLSNRAGRGFAFVDGHPNGPRAGRRPLTTLHAWALPTTDDGWLLGATPGGEQQVPWNAQVLSHLMRFGPDLDEGSLGRALVAPRWELGPDGVRREGAELPHLTARSSHTLARVGGDRVTVAADPRWDGSAVAA